MNAKHFIASRTIWANLAVAGLAYFDPVISKLAAEHPLMIITTHAICNILLRFHTTGPVRIRRASGG